MDDPSPPAKDHCAETSTWPRRVRPPRQSTPSAPASVFVHGLLLAAVSATVFLAAGPVQGSLGIFLLAVGVALTFFPARARVEWPLWFCAAGLLGCGALAFLPARWFPSPAWRTALGSAMSIHLPSTVTPVPWETGFWLTLLGLSCLTGLFLLAHPIRSLTLFWLVSAAVVVCGMYAALSIYAKQTGWHYPFDGGATFGFFPNRNHTATFLVTGSIAALGVLTITLREERWAMSMVITAAMIACVAGLFFYSGSRGGVIFLMLGTLIWAAGLGRAHRNVPLLVSLAALAVAAGVLFVISGGEARARLLGTSEHKAPAKIADTTESVQRTSVDLLPGTDHETPFDFRILIYRDTFALLKDAPICGTGLGAFAPVFAESRHASLSAAAAIHPESDWLMLAAEAGVPALVFALIAAVLLLSRLRGAREHPWWPLRWGCVAAVVTALLHGMVDVPAHRVALGWWILLLTGLGFQFTRGREDKSPLVQRMLFILGGVGALALGVQLIRAEWFSARALTPFAAGKAQEKIVAAFDRGDTVGAMEMAREAVEVSPMSAPLYYQWGVLMLHFEDSDAEVDEAFKAQRLLNPVYPRVPLLQGDAWLPVDPKKAAGLWLEALDRQNRLDRVPGSAGGSAIAFYRDLLSRAGQRPMVQRELMGAINRGPDYLLAWVDGVSADVARKQFLELAAQPGLLESLTPKQRERYLLLWRKKGDPSELDRFLQENPAWQ